MITKTCPICIFSALTLISLLIITAAFSRSNTTPQKTDPNSTKTVYNKLNTAEKLVILQKATEPAFSGKYVQHFAPGVYTCKQCNADLFNSTSKFHSNCGWPSFDDQITGAVKMIRDADGFRTEIICNNCNGHLGHVFTGERYTAKNTRYCVNSISMNFTPISKIKSEPKSEPKSDPNTQPKTQTAFFASGCFWGTEYFLQKAPGVISTTVGYTGGRTPNPTYQQVCTGATGHAESVSVTFDPNQTSYEKLAILFFETHDFTQTNGQGPDLGTQYRSAIFYQNPQQKKTAQTLAQTLKQKGFKVSTEITPAKQFYPAELYHQDYYQHKKTLPYCHTYRKIFQN